MNITIPLVFNEKPRQCLPCGLCCKLYNVKLTETVTKVKDSWCPYAVKGCGCSIYERRPEPCSSFRCAWLENQLPEWAKPDKIHGVVQLADGGKLLILHEDPGYPGAASYSLREVRTNIWKNDLEKIMKSSTWHLEDRVMLIGDNFQIPNVGLKGQVIEISEGGYIHVRWEDFTSGWFSPAQASRWMIKVSDTI